MVTLTFECPSCHAASRAELRGDATGVRCGHCGSDAATRPAAFERGRLVACPVCATDDMYVQKDFPHRIGLAIVVMGFTLSCVAWGMRRSVTTFAILLATAALDAILYYLVGDVTVCYRCLTQVRGAERNPAHLAFELAVGERYRQERMRLDMLRKTADAAADDARGK